MPCFQNSSEVLPPSTPTLAALQSIVESIQRSPHSNASALFIEGNSPPPTTLSCGCVNGVCFCTYEKEAGPSIHLLRNRLRKLLLWPFAILAAKVPPPHDDDDWFGMEED